MISAPKIIEFDKPMFMGLTGVNATPGTPIYRCTREALLVSYPHHRLRGGAWSGGGPFYCVKSTLTHTTGHVTVTRADVGPTTYFYGGCVYGPSKLAAYPTWISAEKSRIVSEQNLTSALYATGYSRARPGNPVASVGQFIIELRDLPAMPFKRALQGASSFKNIPRIALKELSDFRNLGSEYLNVVFGWKPFVSDLRKMYYLWQTIDKRMAQIVRENGKYIRRKASVGNSTSTTEDRYATYPSPYVNVYGMVPGYPSGQSVANRTVTTTEKAWFSGSFRYYIPDTSSSLWDARARLALFGALPTPELLWEVMPWSWLVDWFANVGDVISNASPNAVDNLTMRYSFIMRSKETLTVSTSRWMSNGYDNASNHWPRRDESSQTVQKDSLKTRIGGGNPFGLNVSLASLSGGQKAILAALGLSRSRVK